MKIPKGLLLPQSDEMVCLDVLRVIAALMIVLYHFNAKVEVPYNGFMLPTHFSSAVDLFFFISGYVITRFYGGVSNQQSYRVFLIKRVARLYPLHLLTMCCFVAIGIGATWTSWHLKIPEQFDIACLPANILLLNSTGLCPHLSFNDVSWSISAEMLLYLALPIILFMRRCSRWAALAASFAGFALLEQLAPRGSPHPWYLWTYDGGWARALPSFLLGVAAFDHRHALRRVPFAEGAMWLTLVATMIAMPFVPGDVLIALLIATALFAVATDQGRPVTAVSRAIAPLSMLTYSIYMLHPIVDIVFLSLVAKKIMHLHGIGMDAAIGGGVAITFIMALLSYRFWESPARRWVTEKATGKQFHHVPAADPHGPL